MTTKYERLKLKEGYSYIIGCDEVGRGCLAGPVVAAAVVLDLRFNLPAGKAGIKDLRQVDDSKKLSPRLREELDAKIRNSCLAFGIGTAEHNEIDSLNIHHATLLAMQRAVENLFQCHCEPRVHPTFRLGSRSPRAIVEMARGAAILKHGKDCFASARNDRVFLFIDGIFPIPSIEIKQQTVVAGDSKVLSVASASIIAKVYRDNLMRNLHQKYPIYNFARHKGYATVEHRQNVLKHGLSPIHRLSFCGNLM